MPSGSQTLSRNQYAPILRIRNPKPLPARKQLGMSCQCQFSVVSEELFPELFSLERGKTDSTALHLRTLAEQDTDLLPTAVTGN